MNNGMRIGFSIDGVNTSSAEGMDALFMAMADRRPNHGASHRTSRTDPTSAVAFAPAFTTTRWQEEARLLFGITVPDRAARIVDAILSRLIAPARREQKAAEEARLKKEREEREVQERKAKEEEERKAKVAEDLRLKEAEKAREEAENKARDLAQSTVQEGDSLVRGCTWHCAG